MRSPVGAGTGFQRKWNGNASRAKRRRRETYLTLEDSIPRQHEAVVLSNFLVIAGNGRPAPTPVIRDTSLFLVRSANTTASSCPVK